MKSLTWRQFLRYCYIFSLMGIIVGLSFSKIFLSIGQFMMAGAWILLWFDEKEWLGRLRQCPSGRIVLIALPSAVILMLNGIGKGFRSFFTNRAAMAFASVMILHLAGLLWTTDFSYALKDLRTKLPLFLLPLFFSTNEPFGKRAFYRLLLLFVLAVLVRSLFNTWMIATHHFIDIRDVSRNISHIIFSLLLSLSLFILAYFVLKSNFFVLWHKIVMVAVMAWLLAYTIISQSFTGFTIIIAVLLILIPVMIIKTRGRLLKLSLAAGFLVIFASLFLFLRSVVSDYYHVNPVDFAKLEQTTSRGNRYIHNTASLQTENGNYVWIYIQWDEMRSAWNKRSRIPFDSLGKKNEKIAFTAVRYLASKGWRKDADAIEKLKPGEIDAIEKGVANVIFLNRFGIRGRIYEFLWGFDHYRETGDPTGSTLMQRLEFWKASVGIIKDHWLTGVGTGDMNLAFSAQYEKMHTKLAPDQRWRSHNQFLSIFVGFGVIGFIWFLFSIFYPPYILHRFGDYFFLVFLLIALLSMFTDDTIESQTGVSFFAVFYALLLFARKENDTFLTKN